MAGAGHKLWAAGDVVGASGDTDINTALLQQVVGVGQGAGEQSGQGKCQVFHGTALHGKTSS